MDKKKVDWFAVYLGFAMLMTFLLDAVCVIYMFTHELQPTEQAMFQFMIGMFSAFFGVEAVTGVINNISKRKDTPTVEDKEVQNE